MNYEVLRIIWWLLLGLLLTLYAITDGFDMGVATLLPFIGKKDIERRIIINTIGPVWESNQVWLIVSIGIMFAAWPIVYAVAFSSLYFVLLAALLTIGILRPVAFKFRSKLNSTRWRNTWDHILSISGVGSAFLFGIAIGNVLQGLPFHFDETLRIFYTGSFWSLFNSFSLTCGLVSVAMVIMHGGLYLAIKTTNPIQQRAARWSASAALMLMILFSIGGIFIIYQVPGYLLIHSLGPLAPSNPFHNTVIRQNSAWLSNYFHYPWLLIAPILVYMGSLFSFIANRFRYYKWAFVLSGLCIAGLIATVGSSMFPFILPSTTNPNMSLTVWDASASPATLTVLLFVAAIFVPLILLYTTWAYRILRGKVTKRYIEQNQSSSY